jgi:hypothetical protein
MSYVAGLTWKLAGSVVGTFLGGRTGGQLAVESRGSSSWSLESGFMQLQCVNKLDDGSASSSLTAIMR